jgi:NAD+ synthase (glutamine-hydrolysing)
MRGIYPIATALGQRWNPLVNAGVNPLHQPAGLLPVQQPFPRTDTFQLRFSAQSPASAGLKDPSLALPAFTRLLTQKVDGIRDKEGRVQAIAELGEVLDLFLQKKWTTATQPGKEQAAMDALKRLLGPRGQSNMVLAQINPSAGDLVGNAQKIMTYIDRAERIGADMVVFPELSLMGYPIRDNITRYPFLADENLKWLKEIAKRTQNTRAVVGFVEARKVVPKGEQPQGKEFFNSLAILGNGKIEGIVRKSLLPTYGEFNDYRQFEPSPASGTHPPSTLNSAVWGMKNPPKPGASTVQGHRYGFVICEDSWNDKTFFKRPTYVRDPIDEVMTANPDLEVLVTSNASPSRARKEQLKHHKISHTAKHYGKPVIDVNQVGAIDEHSYDGVSRMYDASGNLVARAKAFREQFMIVNPLKAEGVIHALPKGLDKTLKSKRVFTGYDRNDLGRTYETIVQGIRDYFQKTGFKRAVLGLSGGLDSSVAAVLLADALGPKNVWGFSMPNSSMTTKGSKSDAEKLAINLGIQFSEIPIDEVVKATQYGLNKVFPEMDKRWGPAYKDPTTPENIQARARATFLWSISNQYPGILPIATSDKSELYIGYATINGDMSGGLAPIGDVTKTKLFALARWMNENRSEKSAIPKAVLKKHPGAELKINPQTGKPLTAEEANGPFLFRDEIIWRIENLGQSYQQMLNDTEPFLYEKKHPISREQKQAWLELFFNRMSKAVFKWSIAPPTVIVDGGGTIVKTEFQPVITAGKIPWKGSTPSQRNQVLAEASN